MKRKIFLGLLVVFGIFFITGCDRSKKVSFVENKDYFVKGDFTGEEYDLTERGYYTGTTDEKKVSYFYVICMGEKKSGGYGLKIKEVYKVENHVEIIVEEIKPSKDDVVTMALTYPTLMIEFPKYQEDIIIKSTSGKEFYSLMKE